MYTFIQAYDENDSASKWLRKKKPYLILSDRVPFLEIISSNQTYWYIVQGDESTR